MEGEVEPSNAQEPESDMRKSRSRRVRWQSNGQKQKSTAKSETERSPDRARRPPKSEKGEISLE